MNFELDNKKIEIFYNESNQAKLPIVLSNTFEGEGKDVWKECQNLNMDDFILVAISNINCNNDLSPWECKALYKNDSSYEGKANQYLEFLVTKVIPQAENIIKNKLNKQIKYWAIAGYSLAGLFALYSGYKTNIFKRIASASGSLWYPSFIEYVKSNNINNNIDKIYFSLGNKEKNTKIELLKNVEDRTKEIQAFLGNFITTIYEENPGNHFQDAALRMAKGINWILK